MHVQDAVNRHILNMLEGTFPLDMTHIWYAPICICLETKFCVIFKSHLFFNPSILTFSEEIYKNPTMLFFLLAQKLKLRFQTCFDVPEKEVIAVSIILLYISL